LKRVFAVLCAAWLAATYGCSNAEPGAGSNTNWLRVCTTDAECRSGASCLCGVCTAPCSDTCSELPDATCAGPGSGNWRAVCGDAAAASETDGVCLPACGTDAPCPAGQLCSDGSCLPLAPACAAGAVLQVSSGGVKLEARYGTVFGDALYLPVAHPSEPTDWQEPLTPTPIIAQVTTTQGAPVPDCAVKVVAGPASGSAFPNAEKTDENGEVASYWVAGNGAEQRLSFTILDETGKVTTQSLSARGYANDEGPVSSDAAATESASPAMVHAYYGMPQGASGVQVVLTPHTFPHHAFYSAINVDGLFAGLQNTSDSNDVAKVADADRVLIASVWNVESGAAQQLYAADDAECAPHTQDAGGIQCNVPNAYSTELGQGYVMRLQRRTLAEGESVPEYADLGYDTAPCVSTLGCTDYSLFFGKSGAPEALRLIVAYRYQTADVNGAFSSYIQSYAELPEQNSCLATPRYDVSYLPSFMTDGEYQPLTEAEFAANYVSWNNEVCANYAGAADAGGFRLITGGADVLGAPLIPADTTRPLSLP